MTNKQPYTIPREEKEDRKKDPVPYFTPIMPVHASSCLFIKINMHLHMNECKLCMKKKKFVSKQQCVRTGLKNVCEDEGVFSHVTQSGKHQQRVNTCDSHQFPGKYIKGRRRVCYTKTIFNCNQLLWNSLSTKIVYSTVASKQQQQQNKKKTITFKHFHCCALGATL